MKFDFVIGNPPYQDETVGEQKTFAPPVYHKFLDSAYEVADKVEVIHPARFLFNAGNTPKQWNRKMLSDPHIKVLYYNPKSGDVFPNTLITGGVAITYRDAKKNFGEIGTFTSFPELNTIMAKVTKASDFVGLNSIAVSRTAYRLTDTMHREHPEAIKQLSDGHAYDMSTNIFERLPQIFYTEKPTDGKEYVQIIGREANERTSKFIDARYVTEVENLHKYKIILGRANGASGTLCEETARLITKPFIAGPAIGNTESFLSIGSFETEYEAVSLQKYIQGKFARVLLGILKTTQDVTPEKFAYVPMQNFTSASDIDWSQSVSGIDKQLYKKYGLTEAEIAFIEAHVKELE